MSMKIATRKKIAFLASIFMLVVSLSTMAVTTYAWYRAQFVATVRHNKATLTTTNANLAVAITSFAGDTIGTSHQAAGMNYWTIPFDTSLDDVSYNGQSSTPFYKLAWADGEVGTTATSATKVALNTGGTNGFICFKVTFTNSGSGPLYVYMGSGCSLRAADGNTTGTTIDGKAAKCERVVIRDVANGKNLCYWVPNQASGAQTISSNDDGTGWASSSLAYNCNGWANGKIQIGSVDDVGSPSNANTGSPVNKSGRMPAGWISHTTSVVHYQGFSEVTESSTSCATGQFLCEIGAGSNLAIYVALWAEGTDEYCTSAALGGATHLNLEFVGLSKQLWPAA